MKHKVAWRGTRTVEECIDSLPEPVLVIYGNGPAVAYGPVDPDQIEAVLREKCEDNIYYDFSYHAQEKVLARDRGFSFPRIKPITLLYEDTKALVAK